jgi:hypothetical protein
MQRGPGQQFGPVLRRTQELPGLFREIDQNRDRGGVEDAGFSAARSVGVEVLFAFARIDRDHLAQEAHLLERERDLYGIGRRMEIEADHAPSFRSEGRDSMNVGMERFTSSIASHSSDMVPAVHRRGGPCGNPGRPDCSRSLSIPAGSRHQVYSCCSRAPRRGRCNRATPSHAR